MHEISAVVAIEHDARVVAESLGASKIVRSLVDPWYLVPLSGVSVPDLDDDVELSRLSDLLSPVISKLCGLALDKPIALVFTQYFGGQGGEAAALIRDSSLVYGPESFVGAINEALLQLGVPYDDEHDPFENLGLYKWRSMQSLEGAG